MLAARIFRKRVILNYHSGEADDHLSRWGALVHPWLRLADEIVMPSKYLQQVFARYGYPARMIQNIVDTSQLQYRERPAPKPRLLSTRNLERHYGIDVILESYALIKRRYPDATLTVAGYGREEHTLRDLARSLGDEGIRFVGRQEPPQMAALYADADVFVNASVVDNQPVSVLEAFAAGVPVVSTATGDLRNLIGDNECGLIVPAADPSAMAEAVMALVEQPERALSMANRARRNVEAYTWPHVRDAWRAVYERREPIAIPNACARSARMEG